MESFIISMREMRSDENLWAGNLKVRGEVEGLRGNGRLMVEWCVETALIEPRMGFVSAFFSFFLFSFFHVFLVTLYMRLSPDLFSVN
jgi:hypothetical protein